MTDYSDLLESLLQCHGEPLTLERQGEAYTTREPKMTQMMGSGMMSESVLQYPNLMSAS